MSHSDIAKMEKTDNRNRDVNTTIDYGQSMRQWSQYLASLCAAFGPAAFGANYALSSQLVTDLQQETGPMKMTLEEASWIPSLYLGATIVSGPISGLLANKFGRRTLLCYMGLPVMACLVLIAFSTSKEMLLVGRLLAGLFGVMIYSPVMAYIAEIVSPNVRKTVGSFPSLFMSLGMFSAYVAGFIFPWRTVSLMILTYPITSTTALWFLPETPYWLVETGKEVEAKESLIFFRGPGFDVDSELAIIIAKKKENVNKDSQSKGSSGGLCSLSFFLPWSCVGILYGLCEFNGMGVLMVYMSEVFRRSGTTIDAKMAPMFAGLARVLASCLAPLVIRNVRKKRLFICAALFIALSMSSIGILGQLKHHYPEHGELVAKLDFLPVLGAAGACIGLAIGIIPVLHILMSEVFPTSIRTEAVGLVQASNGIFNTSGVKAYPTILSWFGFHGTFYFFSAINMAMAAWAAMTMINIDGMNLVEVENRYEKMRTDTLKKVQIFQKKDKCLARSESLTV